MSWFEDYCTDHHARDLADFRSFVERTYTREPRHPTNSPDNSVACEFTADVEGNEGLLVAWGKVKLVFRREGKDWRCIPALSGPPAKVPPCDFIEATCGRESPLFQADSASPPERSAK